MKLTEEEIKFMESHPLMFEAKKLNWKELRMLANIQKKVRDEMFIRTDKFR